MIKKVSIIIPVYNEQATVSQVVTRVLQSDTCSLAKEVLVVNDGSSDNTAQVLSSLTSPQVKILTQSINMGKGAAIRTALKQATGDILLIQDADLEYDPRDYPTLLRPILEGSAQVVFGSRFVGNNPHRVMYFWHMIANKLLTLLTNALTNLNLTDMETCYKVFTKPVADQLRLTQNRFGFEPEFTVQVAKLNLAIYEVGISYSGRTYTQGKKIHWHDAFQAAFVLLKTYFTF